MKPKIAFVEEETMTRDERGSLYDGEEHIKIIEPIIEDMTMNIMKCFELFTIQSWKNILILRKPRGKMHNLA